MASRISSQAARASARPATSHSGAASPDCLASSARRIAASQLAEVASATREDADRAVRLMARPRWRYRLLQAAGLAALAGIVYWLAADRRVAPRVVRRTRGTFSLPPDI